MDLLSGSASPTAREVPGEDALSELWAGYASGVVAARCGVPDGSGDQRLLSLAGALAEVFVGPCEDRDDAGGRGSGDIPPSTCRLRPSRRVDAELADEVVEVVVGDFLVAP